MFLLTVISHVIMETLPGFRPYPCKTKKIYIEREKDSNKEETCMKVALLDFTTTRIMTRTVIM